MFLVAGATGNVGGELVRALTNAGEEVRAFDGFDAQDIPYGDNRLIWSIHRKDEQAARGDPFIVRRAIREGVG